MKRQSLMMIMELLFTVLAGLGGTASVAPSAGFYRAWQGNRLDSMTSRDFVNALPEFMDGIHVYGDVLNQYLVAVPPADKPAYVADEFALVALTDEESYRRIRATPEGKAYDVIGGPINWRVGYSTFFLGLRKPGMAKAEFLRRLSQHVQLASTKFGTQGLRGYIIMANEDYEAAFMNWSSEEAMNKAFASPGGQEVSHDGEDLFKFLQWGGAHAFDGVHVSPGGVYRSK